MQYKHKYLILGGLLSSLSYVYLAVNSQFYGDVSLFEFMLVMLFSAGICMSLWVYYWHQQKDMPILVVISFAILFRFIGVFSFPILEDDMYRYLWDGRMTIQMGSPYLHAPAEFFSTTNLSERFEDILGLINYPFVATVYGPVCQWIFAGAYLIAPGEIWPLQLFFATIDIGLIVLLSRLAKPIYVMLYAWSPLIIKEFAFTAHPDVIGAFFLILAYCAYQRERYITLGTLLALATGVKVFALILAPFLMGFKLRAWLSFAITAFAVSLPWGFSTAWFPPGLQAMSAGWLFNAPLYFLLQTWFSFTSIKIGLLSLLASGYAFYYLNAMRNWKISQIRVDYLFMALFLCTPVLNPWYLVWLLPFAVLTPSVWAWAASISLLLSYGSGINLSTSTLEAYQIPTWLIWLEFSSVVLISLMVYRFKPSRHSTID